MKSFTVLVALALAAPAALAEAGRESLHRGEVTAIDRVARTFHIETATGPERFTLGPEAEVSVAGEPRSFDVLAVGQSVAVRAGPGALARSVEVVNPNELEGQLEDLPAFDVADTATLTAVDAEQRLLRVQTDDGPRSYQVAEDAHIRRGGDDVALASLRPNDRVVVTAHETSPGRFTAQAVTVVSSGPVPSDRAEPQP